MKNLKIKNVLICFLFVTLFLSNAVYVYAQGEGVPGSSGTKPLNFVSCTLEDGSSIDTAGGITTQPRFKIQFDKDIVNILVWENNSKCFTMTDGNSNVPIVVSKIDDTVDFDNRQIVYMHPSGALQPGKSYYIKVAPNLIAKNGQSTLAGTTGGKGMTISFKTEGQAVQPVSSGSNPNNSGSVSQQTQTDSGKNTPVQNSNQPTNNNQAASSNTVTNSTSQSGGNNKSANNPSNTTASGTAPGQNSAQNNNSANATNTANTANAANNSTINSADGDNKNNSKAVVNNKEAAAKGISLNTMIAIGTGIIVAIWVLIEIFVKRRKKGEGSNKPGV